MIVAIEKAVRGASAMGFAWFQLRDAQVTTEPGSGASVTEASRIHI